MAVGYILVLWKRKKSSDIFTQNSQNRARDEQNKSKLSYKIPIVFKIQYVFRKTKKLINKMCFKNVCEGIFMNDEF